MGGGVMRAATKVAGVGIVGTGLRSGFQVNASPAEHSAMRVAASRSASSALSVSSSIGGVSSVADGTSSSNHKVSWEMHDDWELVCSNEEEVVLGGFESISSGREPMARMLFGGVPSLDEVKEATADLKEALDKVYLSNSNSADAADGNCLSLLSNSAQETNDCVALDVNATSVPKPAIQAFKLLSDSPAVQSVVASIATDPNVWNAVLTNPAYMEFIRSHKTNEQYEDDASSKSCESSVKIKEHIDSSQPKDRRNPFVDFLQNLKVVVVEIVNKATAFLRTLFASPFAENAAAGSDTFNNTIGASMMGLAIMVIMIVLVKRA